MSEDQQSLDDQRYAELFSSREEALLSGKPFLTTTEDFHPVPVLIEQQLARDLACADLLRRVLGGSRSKASSESLPLTQLGRFQLRRELGRGGFGIVFLAFDPLLGREVALKVPRPEVVVTPQLRQRFQREARAVSPLQHPNLVPVYEVGEAGPICYIVSAYCPGMDLSQWLNSHSDLVPLREAAALVATLARAVGYAHDHGIIHRDLKPSNILLEQAVAGRTPTEPSANPPLSSFLPRITDFGLAKNLLEVASDGPTRSDALLGTPCYMAPEQAGGRNHKVGPATDIHALGIILYELLTQRRPFQGESAVETLLLVRDADPVPPSRLRPKVPRNLETICLKCLQKDPAKRYSNGGELADDLDRFLTNQSIRARPTSVLQHTVLWCRRRPTVAVLSATLIWLLAFVTLGAVLTAWHRADLLTEAERAWGEASTAQQRELQQRLRAESLLVREYLSRGQRLAEEGDSASALLWFAEALRLQQDRPNRQAMHRFRLAVALRQQPRLHYAWFHEAAVRHAEFSRDGKQVVTASEDGTARVWDVATGRPLSAALQHRGPVTFAAFDPEGTRVWTLCEVWNFGARTTELRQWDVATAKELRPVLFLPTWIEQVRISPDGQWIVCWCIGHMIAYLWNISDPQNEYYLLDQGQSLQFVAFSPCSHWLVTTSRQGSASIWEVASGRMLRRLAHPGRIYHASFSSDGRRLVTASTNFYAFVWDTANGQRLASLPHEGNVAQAHYSPDGKFLLTAGHDRMVRLWDARTHQTIWSRKHGGRVFQATFSADGKLVVASGEDGTVAVWDVASGRLSVPLLRHAGAIHHACSSPDGSLFLTASADGTARVYGPPPFRIATLRQTGFGRWVGFSPDGRWLVSCAGKEAYVWDGFTGERVAGPLVHEELVYHACFSPDGQRVLTFGRERNTRVWQVPDGRLLALLPHQDTVRSAEFSPDGQLILTAAGSESIPERGSRVYLWHAPFVPGKEPRPLYPALSHAQVVSSATFRPDGRQFVTVSTDGWVRFWQTATGKPMGQIQPEGEFVRVSFDRDGHLLIHSRSQILLWNVAEARPVAPPVSLAVPARVGLLTSDGQRLLIAGDDGVARIWNIATNQPVGAPMVHPGRIFHATYSPDGTKVATVGDDSFLRLWDAETGEPALIPEKWDLGWVYHVAFSPDGTRLALAGGTPGAALFDVRTDLRPVDDLQALTRVLSAQELSEHGVLPLSVQAFREAWIRSWKQHPRDLPSTPLPRPGWELRQDLRHAIKQFFEGRFDLAYRILSQAIERSPEDPMLYLYRADAARLLKRDAQALEDMATALRLAGEDGNVHACAGRIFIGLHRWRDALPLLKRAVEQNPNDAPTRSLLGAAHLYTRQPAEAISFLTQTVRQAPWDALAWCCRGQAYLRQGEETQAAADFAEAIARGSVMGVDWFHHGGFLLIKGDRDAYLQLCRTAYVRFNLAEISVPSHFLIRLCLFLPDSSVPRARLLLLAENTAQAYPTDWAVLYTQALASYRNHRFDEAIRLADQAARVRAEPSWKVCQVQSFLVRAMAHHRLGQTQQARHWLRQARDRMNRRGELLPDPMLKDPYPGREYRVERILLLREAEALLEGSSPSAPPSKP